MIELEILRLLHPSLVAALLWWWRTRGRRLTSHSSGCSFPRGPVLRADSPNFSRERGGLKLYQHSLAGCLGIGD